MQPNMTKATGISWKQALSRMSNISDIRTTTTVDMKKRMTLLRAIIKWGPRKVAHPRLKGLCQVILNDYVRFCDAYSEHYLVDLRGIERPNGIRYCDCDWNKQCWEDQHAALPLNITHFWYSEWRYLLNGNNLEILETSVYFEMIISHHLLKLKSDDSITSVAKLRF